MKILSSFLLLAAVGLAADHKPGDEKAVRDAVNKFNDAAHKGDEAALKGMIADDLVYGHSTAKIENKAECVANLVKTKPNFVMQDGATVSLYGKTAVVHGKMVANNTANGKATQTPLDILMVWVKNGSSWMMVARHTTRLPS